MRALELGFGVGIGFGVGFGLVWSLYRFPNSSVFAVKPVANSESSAPHPETNSLDEDKLSHLALLESREKALLEEVQRHEQTIRKQQEAIAMHNPSIQKSSRRGNENEQTPIQRKAAARSHSTLEDSSRAEESPLARTSSEGIKLDDIRVEGDTSDDVTMVTMLMQQVSSLMKEKHSLLDANNVLKRENGALQERVGFLSCELDTNGVHDYVSATTP
mmetsp:Transcript_35688/g.68463  ORF Transcript_35688/g.68463 Transcript_35688/m.68463 type:complete len:217 (+) Transcript_35688:357-1007(+)